jgi:hypothetical protein
MASSFTSFFLPPFSSWRLPNFADFWEVLLLSFDVPPGGEDWESADVEFSPTALIFFRFFYFFVFFASVLRRKRSPSSSQRATHGAVKDSMMKMLMLRFARECVYI